MLTVLQFLTEIAQRFTHGLNIQRMVLLPVHVHVFARYCGPNTDVDTIDSDHNRWEAISVVKRFFDLSR